MTSDVLTHASDVLTHASDVLTHVFIDMDEVLCDFIDGACKAHGTTKKELLTRCKPNEWDIVKPLGVTLDVFWERIHDQGSLFWEGLEPLPWLDDLIACVESFVGKNWYVVSAPSRCDTSYTGKVKWLKTKFGRKFDRFFLTPHKELLAKPHCLLIDDRAQNIVNFMEANGKGLLFPTAFNYNSHWVDSPVAYVRGCLSHFTFASHVPNPPQ